MHNITPQEAWNLLISQHNSHLIDVRRPDEWLHDGTPDLSSINKNLIKITWEGDPKSFLSMLEDAVDDKDCHLIFICRGGIRSAAAATAAHGYNHCYNLSGGFNKWKLDNLPSLSI